LWSGAGVEPCHGQTANSSHFANLMFHRLPSFIDPKLVHTYLQYFDHNSYRSGIDGLKVKQYFFKRLN